ncbi:chromosome partitioning protein ParA [Aureimonas sp. AU12]|uniref:chromosome partitioning protein ParA n=1 Tax=Aureimonas sp. AU12 TaxID=1638161 RepID=UPI0012E37103|nr:chromosome partitioning protein ParA [Aureimonas sp. AU12]
MTPPTGERELTSAVPVETPAQPRPGRNAPLDGIGQRNEMLRVRITEMSERLGELRTLTDDFSMLIDPIEAIAEELPKAKGRILELEAILAQEMDTGQALRREVDSLLGRYSAAASDLSTSTARTARLETLMREQETAFDEQRLTLREKSTHANALERQLLAEVEQNQSLALEVKTLRAEAQISDQALSEAERMLGEIGEQRHLLDGENRRLQAMAEEHSAEIVALSARSEDLDQQVDIHLQTIATLEAQVAHEQSARQKAVAQHEIDLGALKTERSSSVMRVEALTARLAATDQILAQVRNQLREREETMRSAERANKEAIAERSTFERRIESMKTETARLAAHLQESQKGRGDLESRCDMLVKALAAKDASLESVTTRANNLSDRVEALTLRFEQDRLALEATNRRLIEELQNEKAERTLAQGALDIARESRAALQRQNETLKRATRSRHGDAPSHGEADYETVREERASNVRPFAAPDKND